MKIIVKIISVFGLLLCLLAVAHCALQAEAPKPAEPQYTEVKYWADSYSYRWQGEDRILLLRGNVKFVHGDTIMLANSIDYHESTKIAVATGNLKIFDGQNVITGDKCTMNLDVKKGMISGSVIMIIGPRAKPDTSKIKQELKDEITVTCDAIDYYYKDKKAVISTPLKLVQKDRVVTADSATYSGKDDIVELIGNVQGRDDKAKQTFSAPKVKMSLNDSDEWVEAEQASGTFQVQENEESKPAERAVSK